MFHRDVDCGGEGGGYSLQESLMLELHAKTPAENLIRILLMGESRVLGRLHL